MIGRIVLILALVSLIGVLYGQKWTMISKENIVDKGRKDIIPQKYVLYNIDDDEMRSLLWNAEEEGDIRVTDSRLTISVGLPDETIESFRIVRYQMMEPGLQSKYPDIRTFYGVSTDNPLRRIRIDYTNHGFRAVISEPGKDKVFIDHYQRNDRNTRISYYKSDYISDLEWSCSYDEEHYHNNRFDDEIEFRWGDCQLRIYRLAQAATGEYSNFHGAYNSGQSALVMSAVVTVINRVNEVYEAEVAVRLFLVNNTDQIFFYDPATDPYTANNASTMLGENISTCNSIIGSANYDIGHVFGGLGNNGVAYLSSVCTSNKAGGVTTSTNPVGDPFSIDYVSHEMGHQFGANHTQNNNCNRNSATAMEPGSASTIMGYAGICSPNVQAYSDAYFHAISIQEIKNFLLGNGNNCAQIIPSFINSPPVVSPMPNYTIPRSTPFLLTLDATDPDGDPLIYAWDQMNNQVATMPPLSTNTGGPAFRSIFATPDPWRYFPNLNTILAGNTSNTWEVLPSVGRTMNFRGVVRDFAGMAGCNSEINITVTTVAAAGPFEITSHNAATTWLEGEFHTITWNVAGSTGNGINCANVDILLSYDGGQNFNTVLASEVPNNGSFQIEVPDGTTSAARVMVKCSDNIFLDINDANITIDFGYPTFMLNPSPANMTLCQGQSAQFNIEVLGVLGFNNLVQLSIPDLPAGISAELNPVTLYPGNTSVLTLTNTSAVPNTYELEITGSSGLIVKSETITIHALTNDPVNTVTLDQPADNSANVSIFPLFTWNTDPTATGYVLQVSEYEDFSDLVYQVDGLTLASHKIAVELTGLTEYFWRVMPYNSCADGLWSDIFSFETESCFVYRSLDVPILIPASGTPTVNSYHTVTDRGVITDLDVLDLIGLHTWVSDLRFTLYSPDGTNVRIWNRPCNTGQFQNFNINLDQQAPVGSWPCPPTDGGTYRPSNSINTFNSKQINGQWRLRVQDLVNQDGGSLQSWAIKTCVNNFCRLTVDKTGHKGAGSLYAAIECSMAGDTIRFAHYIENDTIDLGELNLTIDKAIVIEADISKNIHIISSNPAGLIVNSAPMGGNGLRVSGLHLHVSGTNTSVIVNNGKMSLHDVVIYEKTDNTEPSVLMMPEAELNISGNCAVLTE